MSRQASLAQSNPTGSVCNPLFVTIIYPLITKYRSPLLRIGTETAIMIVDYRLVTTKSHHCSNINRLADERKKSPHCPLISWRLFCLHNTAKQCQDMSVFLPHLSPSSLYSLHRLSFFASGSIISCLAFCSSNKSVMDCHDGCLRTSPEKERSVLREQLSTW